jgi:hypothetical protein
MHSAAGPAATRGTAYVRDAGTARTTRGASARRRRCTVTAVLGEPTAARRQRTGDGRERQLTGVETAARHDGDGRAVRGGRGGTAVVRAARPRTMARLGRRRDGRGGREPGGASEAGCRDARHAVPTTALSRVVGAARGSQAATVCCRAGSARRAASDMWGPLVSDF